MSPIVGNTSSEGKKPDAPFMYNATALGADSAEVNFEPGVWNGKGGVTYTIVDPNYMYSQTVTYMGTPVTLTGLMTGTMYQFYAYATTSYGVDSDYSMASNPVTPQSLDANYIISGGDGNLYYSTNLQSWSSASGLYAFNSAFYVNSKFYISDGQGTGAYSTNGISWTTVSNSAFSGTKIAYANSKFVARGYGTAIYVSTDFITWTARTGAANYSYYGAINRAPVYFGGKWYTHAPGTKVLEFSTDTVTWSKTSTTGPVMPFDSYWAVNYFGSYFYALSTGWDSNAGLLVRSTDGNVWSTVTLPTQPSGNISADSLTSGNGRIFINAGSGGVLTSTNGTTWTSATMPSNFSPINNKILYGTAGKWIASLNNDYSGPINVVSSTNGTTFSLGTNINTSLPTLNDANGDPMSFNFGDMIYGNKYVASAYAQDYSNWPPVSKTIFRSSTDAVTWTGWTTSYSRNGNAFGTRIYYANGYFATGASDAYNDSYNVLISTNATSWSKVIGPSNTSYGSLVAAVNNTFIWAGIDSIIHTSTNGSTWTQRSTQISGYWATWAYGNSRYLSSDFYATPIVVYSTNLTSWSSTSYSGAMTPQVQNYYTASNGTTAVFVPNNPVNYVPAYSTTNGTSWTTSDLYINGWTFISNPAYGNGVFVVAVDYTGMFVSSNGENWTQYNFPDGSNKPDNIDFSGTQFYATGGNYGSVIYSSTDAITWTANSAMLSPSFGYAEFPQMRVIGKL
jgi:hypothetical protein